MRRRSKLPKPKFYLKAPNGDKDTGIDLIYYYGLKKPLKYATGEVIHPRNWDQQKQEINGMGMNVLRLHELDDYLTKIKIEAKNVFKEFGVIPTDEFRDRLDEKMGFGVQKAMPKRMKLLDFMLDFIRQRRALKGITEDILKNRRDSTDTFVTWYLNLKKFEKHTGQTLYFEDINWTFLDNFKEFCFLELALSANYLKLGFAKIKQIVNEGRKRGLTDNVIVKERGFSVKTTPYSHVVFYMEDFEKLMAYPFTKKATLRYRDLLIIGGFCGMRVNMWQKIDRSLVKVVNGRKYIELFTQKTGTQVAIPFHPMFEAALERCNYQVPDFGETNLGEKGKEIWRIVGVTDIVEKVNGTGGIVNVERVPKCDIFHLHSLRRSFATNMLLMGVPLKYIQLILGHSSIAITEKYINISGRLNADHVAKHMELVEEINKRKG